jgi:hypothetical protein
MKPTNYIYQFSLFLCHELRNRDLKIRIRQGYWLVYRNFYRSCVYSYASRTLWLLPRNHAKPSGLTAQTVLSAMVTLDVRATFMIPPSSTLPLSSRIYSLIHAFLFRRITEFMKCMGTISRLWLNSVTRYITFLYFLCVCSIYISLWF